MNTAFYGHEDPISATTPADETRREEIDALADTIAVSAARIDAATHELCTSIGGSTSLAVGVAGRVWLRRLAQLAAGAQGGRGGEKVRWRGHSGAAAHRCGLRGRRLSYCKVRAMTGGDRSDRAAGMARSATGANWRKCAAGSGGSSGRRSGRAGGGARRE